MPSMVTASPANTSQLFNAAGTAKQTVAQCISMNSPPPVLAVTLAAYADTVVSVHRSPRTSY